MTYFPTFAPSDLLITKVTRLKQQRLILDLFHYRLCGAAERHQLEAKACLVAKVCSKPIYVFRELSAYLTEQQIVAPGYTPLHQNKAKRRDRDDPGALLLSPASHKPPNPTANKKAVRYSLD